MVNESTRGERVEVELHVISSSLPLLFDRLSLLLLRLPLSLQLLISSHL